MGMRSALFCGARACTCPVRVQVFEVAGDVLQPQLAHNLCRLVAEQDSELHSTAVQVGQQGMPQSNVQAGCPCDSGCSTVPKGAYGYTGATAGCKQPLGLQMLSLLYVSLPLGMWGRDVAPWGGSPGWVLF